MRDFQELSSRRLSESYAREFTNSFGSNFPVVSASTVSSPRFASRALQEKAKADDNWEILLAKKGVVLNSKWNEAEKYIINPFSGQVPIECLSSRFQMSRPSLNRTSPPSCIFHQEKKVENVSRNVGTQRTLAELASPPLMEDKSIKCSSLKSEIEIEAEEGNKDKEERKREEKGGLKQGCLPFKSLWKQRNKHKSSKKQACFLFFYHFPAC